MRDPTGTCNQKTENPCQEGRLCFFVYNANTFTWSHLKQGLAMILSFQQCGCRLREPNSGYWYMCCVGQAVTILTDADKG